MQAFFDKLAAISLAAKLGALGMAVILLIGGYWNFFYSEMVDELDGLEKQGARIDQEKKEYERRKLEYLAFRAEVNKLLEDQKELLRVLPKSDDIEQFIEQVQAQVEVAGLTKVASTRDAAQPVEMYVKIPIRMSLTGTYHRINHFVRNVGELKRIVNLEDLQLQPAPESTGSLSQPTLLNARFTATTFMFQDKGTSSTTAPGVKPGTTITSGSGK